MMQDTGFRYRPRLAPAWMAALALALMAGLTTGASAQTDAPSARTAATAKPQATRPGWKELTREQQQALQPLAAHWETLPEDRKRKWLALSKNYHTMPATEQAKLHSRMRDWVLLSQQQRTQARLNYEETKKLPSEQKSAQWQAYQQLSAEEKRRLAARAPAKPAGVAVVRPVPHEKLPQVTTTRTPRQDTAAAVPAAPSPIHRNTLLPRQPAPSPVPPPAVRPDSRSGN